MYQSISNNYLKEKGYVSVCNNNTKDGSTRKKKIAKTVFVTTIFIKVNKKALKELLIDREHVKLNHC